MTVGLKKNCPENQGWHFEDRNNFEKSSVAFSTENFSQIFLGNRSDTKKKFCETSLKKNSYRAIVCHLISTIHWDRLYI